MGALIFHAHRGMSQSVPRHSGQTRNRFDRFSIHRLTANLLCLIVCALLAAGCAVGPDFVRPKPPAVTQYTHEQAPEQTEAADGQAQRFEMGAKIAEDWWRLFNSPELDAVVRKAIDGNRSLQSALAHLRQSRENLRAGYGVFFPQINGSFNAAREKFSPAQFGFPLSSSTFSLYTLNGTVSYVVDVFGGERRAVENLGAQVDYQMQTTRAAYLTLVGNAVNTCIAEAAYRAQIEATEQIIGFQKQQLQTTENQVKAGTVPYSNALAIRAQLAATEATLPPLKKSLDQAQHLLTALVGQTPEQWAPPPLDLAGITLPVEVPVTLPSELTRRRPDILAAEAQLHSASANIGVATAALFPSLTLSGNYGSNSLDITKLLTPGTGFWSLGSDLAAPIFHGGTLWFQRRAAIQAYQASLSDYQQAVVAGFQQVADALRALEFDARTLEAQSESLVTAERTLKLVEANYRSGLANYLQVLSADSQYQQARLGFVQAQALRLQDTTALFVSLGGGWWEPEKSGAGKVTPK
ncbi:MAG: efflux transporter outer membrane subunit [Syntrophobacteraceae bacterium]